MPSVDLNNLIYLVSSQISNDYLRGFVRAGLVLCSLLQSHYKSKSGDDCEIADQKPDVDHLKRGRGRTAEQAVARKQGYGEEANQVEQGRRFERAVEDGGEVAENQNQERGEEGGEKLSGQFPSQEKGQFDSLAVRAIIKRIQPDVFN